MKHWGFTIIAVLLVACFVLTSGVSALELRTYKNIQYGFSIKYPAGWVIQEDQSFADEHYIVLFKDKPTRPDAVFEIKDRNNYEHSFDDSYTLYKGEIASKYPVKIMSEKRIKVGNADGYEIDYITYIGETACYSRDIVVNGGKLIPIIKWGRCNIDAFSQYLSLFNEVTNSFTFTQSFEEPKKQDSNAVTLAMKSKKRLSLVAVKNNGELPVYGVELKAMDGGIRFVKTKGWDRQKLDASTVMIQTNDSPILKGRNMVVLLIFDNKDSGLEWKMLDRVHNIIAFGALTSNHKEEMTNESKIGEQKELETEKVAAKSESVKQNSVSTSEEWILVARAEKTSTFGPEPNTVIFCPTNVWRVAWAGEIYGVRIYSVDHVRVAETSMSGELFDLQGCYYVFPVSVPEGGYGLWVYHKGGDVTKLLPAPNKDLQKKMRNAKMGTVSIGSEPSRVVWSIGYIGNALYKPSIGTTGLVASLCVEAIKPENQHEMERVVNISWSASGEFNTVKVYKEDDNQLKLIYESPLSKNNIYVHEAGCYHAYIDATINSEYEIYIIKGTKFLG